MVYSMKTDPQIDNRFQSDAAKYASYLETPEGQLRLDLAFANLQEFFPTRRENKPLSALDLGCGTGATAIRLARLGYSVTLLDSSEAMLEIAQRASHEAGVSERVTVRRGHAAKFSTLFSARSFDVILSHNVLEYVDDPGAVLAGAAGLLRDSSSVLSVLVRNQAGEVLKAAIQAGDLAGAEDALKSEWGQESLYGGKVRLFTLEGLRDLTKAASLSIIAERGVRMVADYLPAKVSRSDEYHRIFELERKLSGRPEFVAASRYIQVLARGTRT
ncbi:MAG TPA: methyltransferase domain-containing protein [Candidatus Angelobacter sp.]|nr:methyltransferase domain-containing protein [Candidatus Angelobacter sp.]